LPEAIQAIEVLHRAGLLLIVVTNQPDVGNGVVSQHVIEEMHRRLRKSLPIDDIKVCFHSQKDNCLCRKPQPGMLLNLKDLDFTYPGREQTFDGLNIFIRKDQMTALVGESGSGKSTVTDLVLGLQIPERGQVLIDGVPLGDWKQNSFRERIGYVPQDPILFHASVRDNLLWSFEQAKENDLWEALHLANAEDFVKELPGHRYPRWRSRCSPVRWRAPANCARTGTAAQAGVTDS